jgi:hypothetical protein
MMSPAPVVPVPPDVLAVPRAGMVRSPVPMNRATETVARLTRTKERLYVLCQVGGWGTFTLAYIALGSLGRTLSLNDACIITACNALGLLVAHLYRAYVRAHGWAELGWGALLPRVVVASVVVSVVWTATTWPLYAFFYTGQLPARMSHTALFLYSVFNGIWIYALWSALYFVYHIFERLRRMQIDQLQLAASAKEAELRALKSQVNPHFLFNSLNSLRALIDEDAPRAREAVTRLANMLRYSLQSGQQETVPLEDEIRIVEDYLALEHIRHENRLRVRWAVAAEARPVNVPPMLLQTLVENAVKYGISTRRDGGELVIAARLDGAGLTIRVSNPGDLTAPTSAAAARAGSSTGVGLRNASERLKLLFGERATLTLLPEPAGCVTAEVLIPLNPAAR